MSIYYYVCALLRARFWLNRCAALLAFILACAPLTTCAVVQKNCLEALAYTIGTGAEYGIKMLSTQIANKTITPPPLVFVNPDKVYKPRLVEKGVETFTQLALEGFLLKLFEKVPLPTDLTLNELHKDFILGMRIPRYVELTQASLELLKDITHLLAVLVQDIFSSSSIHCYSYSLQYPLAGPQGHSTTLTCGPQDLYCTKQGAPTCAGIPLEEYVKKYSRHLTSTLGHLSIELFAFIVGILLVVLAYWISIYVARFVHTNRTTLMASRSLVAQQGLIFIEKTINNIIDVVVLDPVRDQFLNLIEKIEILEEPGSSSALIDIKDVRDTLLTGEKSTKIVKIGTALKKFKNPFSKFLSNVMYGKRTR